MAARVTNAQVLAAFARFDARLAALEAAPAPAAQAPAQPSAFEAFLRERAASRLRCAVHAAGTCTRAFTPKSTGGASHTACANAECGNARHHHI